MGTGRAASKAAVIVGAGFSHAAGLPLTKDLFHTSNLPRHTSKTAEKQHTEVMEAWVRWQQQHPTENAEEWLRMLYEANPPGAYGTTFERAIRFALARLVDVPGGKNSVYHYGITTSITTRDHRVVRGDIHVKFWDMVRTSFDVTAVVSMNYDILVEQALKADLRDHRSAPLCHYGGHPVVQVVRTYTNLPKKEFRETHLGTQIALYKMHGSINWSMDTHGFEIRDHVGAVFRCDDTRGALAIVPPVAEKDQPDWLSLVWRYAEKALRARPLWIVCGYSLPVYDQALRDFFSRAAQGNDSLHIAILDPFAADLIDRWQQVAPSAKKIVPLPGLPEVFEAHSWDQLHSILR